ncbi:MAG TPA: YbhB/YbcL family Raf kinase inhibitor-like protein [Candidatus Kapabacteria bacterium]|nr:YbhB/YbcL family Raf kinase inhibitor-like protein [Candidatus Kapabacteria bacterium]
MSFTITSSSFGNGAVIPKQYTGEGEDISPELSWSGAPNGTKSFVLICDDPDAPNGTWTHWVAFDIPADLTALKSGAKKGMPLGHGIKQGHQDFGNVGYQGPMPPRGHGRHRYYFTLYALDCPSLGIPEGAARSKIEHEMQGHILAKTQWMGTYERK